MIQNRKLQLRAAHWSRIGTYLNWTARQSPRTQISDITDQQSVKQKLSLPLWILDPSESLSTQCKSNATRVSSHLVPTRIESTFYAKPAAVHMQFMQNVEFGLIITSKPCSGGEGSAWYLFHSCKTRGCHMNFDTSLQVALNVSLTWHMAVFWGVTIWLGQILWKAGTQV